MIAPPPRVETPTEARQACHLATGSYATLADLELVNRQRGRDLVECDSRRALAVSAHDREHAAEDEQARQRDVRRRPWWRRLF